MKVPHHKYLEDCSSITRVFSDQLYADLQAQGVDGFEVVPVTDDGLVEHAILAKGSTAIAMIYTGTINPKLTQDSFIGSPSAVAIDEDAIVRVRISTVLLATDGEVSDVEFEFSNFAELIDFPYKAVDHLVDEIRNVARIIDEKYVDEDVVKAGDGNVKRFSEWSGVPVHKDGIVTLWEGPLDETGRVAVYDFKDSNPVSIISYPGRFWS